MNAQLTRHVRVLEPDRACASTSSCPSHGDRSAFAGFRFPPEVITVAVCRYLRYGLSYRDLEALLAERGVEVDHVTVYRSRLHRARCGGT